MLGCVQSARLDEPLAEPQLLTHHGKLIWWGERMRWFLILAVLLASASPSRADPPDMKARVAPMAFLAQFAPKVCPGLKTNADAVAAIMTAVHMDEGELLSHYGPVTLAAAQAFIASALRDSRSACQQVRIRLGADGLGLVTEDGDSSSR